MSTAKPADFEPYSAAFAADPYPVYSRLREHTPVFYSAQLGMTLFTRYDDIRSLLLDGRLGRTLDHVKHPEEIARQRVSAEWQRLPSYSRYVRVNLLETEGTEHARVRRLVSAALTPRRVRDLRGRIQALVDEMLLTLLPQGRMNFLADLAEPLPVYMISDLLGWPLEERHRLRPWSAQIVRLYEKDHSAEDEAQAEAATTEFAAMLGELADRRRNDPRDDLISGMVAAVDEGERLTRDELIATCMLLLNAGHEATVNAAGNGLLALLHHPEQAARLRAAPAAEPAILTSAVEEILRFDAPLQLFHRYVLEDLSFAGVELRKGDTVGLLYGCANRDPQVFERADEFDVGRNPNRHLSFGTGTHFCLGAPLARLEIEILLGTVLRKLSELRLDGAEPEFRTGLVFRALKALSVCW
ncbi:MAG TPA: cytochrome P450 [Steroidobacteraceae bacterium]|nr:cytochrome P450 [Steroidobacteraceae bacterium]